MVTVNKEKCIGCGCCVADCFPGELEIIDGKACSKGKFCMECGHCVAVCPANAITLNDYDASEVLELQDIDNQISPWTYLNHLKSRRSIRHFTDTPVTDDEIRLILEAGRFSPTGGNRQDVSYHISKDNVEEYKTKVMEALYDLGTELKTSDPRMAMYGDMWINMYKNYKEKGNDTLFFNAPTVITVSSPAPQSALIAAAHMESMVYSLDLGCVYSGFTTRAVEASEKLKTYLKLKEGYSVYAVLVIGHPAISFRRTVPRKPADTVWN